MTNVVTNINIWSVVIIIMVPDLFTKTSKCYFITNFNKYLYTIKVTLLQCL